MLYFASCTTTYSYSSWVDAPTSSNFIAAGLKKCLELPEIEGDWECCALTALAKVGIIEGTKEPGMAEEVEKAIQGCKSTSKSFFTSH
jgi:hypothetical protein